MAFATRPIENVENNPMHSSRHQSGLDPAEAGAVMRYRYRVGGKDYEGDGFQIGGKTRAGGLIAKALIRKYPEGRDVDVYYDPADPARSALDRKDRATRPPIVVFVIVFTVMAGILTAHAIAGKMIMMSNGLPMFALGLPSAALLVAVGAFVAYFNQRRDFKASGCSRTATGSVRRYAADGGFRARRSRKMFSRVMALNSTAVTGKRHLR